MSPWVLVLILVSQVEPRERWRLEGSHTTASRDACTVFVSPRGNDARNGRTPESAVASSARALGMAKPRDVLCFAEGTYSPLVIRRVRGPLVIRTLPGAEHRAIFTNRTLAYGDAVTVESSTDVQLFDLRLERAQRGVAVWNSSFVRIEGVEIEGVGQEAIHVGRQSHHCDVIGNSVRYTGKVTAKYGEGLYVGTGRRPGDATHDVFIAYNEFDSVRAEGIELKPYTFNHVVRGNTVSRCSTTLHAAIAVAVQPASFGDGNVLVEDNRILAFSTTEPSIAGIAIGHGRTIVRNNEVHAIEGGVGIRVHPTDDEVWIERNTVWVSGGGEALSLEGEHRNVVTRDNVADGS